ncbi:uncharacterized protein LOC136028510 [Artemia franciscana]|uniref:uncharacterized protein LOC136028510 n=1 Tax=Artemia franciscana TaxID=6661 RepID=UPI0032DA4986
MRSLKAFLNDYRDGLVQNAMKFSKTICDEIDIPLAKRRNIRGKKPMSVGKAAEEPQNSEEEKQILMFERIDTFQLEINTRCQGMEEISLRFAILETRNLLKSSEIEVLKLVGCLVNKYEEISLGDILNEIPPLRRFLQAANHLEEVALKWSSLRLLQFIVEYELPDTIPNLTLALRFYLTLCVAVASCKRSLSKLKLNKSYFKSTMSQGRLSSLAMLSIENSVAKRGFDEVMSKFVEN